MKEEQEGRENKEEGTGVGKKEGGSARGKWQRKGVIKRRKGDRRAKRREEEEGRVAKCRSSTPVRNKEQKIDRLLSFMFLRGKAARLVRPFVRLLSLPLPPSPFLLPLTLPSTLRFLSFAPPTYCSLSLSFAATYNKTNRGNSALRAMGKEPESTQKNAKGPREGGGKTGRRQGKWKGRGVSGENERHVYAKKEQESGSVETGRDCIRRLLRIVRVFWLGIESNYQESGLHRIGRGEGGGGGDGSSAVPTLTHRSSDFGT